MKRKFLIGKYIFIYDMEQLIIKVIRKIIVVRELLLSKNELFFRRVLDCLIVDFREFFFKEFYKEINIINENLRVIRKLYMYLFNLIRN